jgi:hypothetical protein
MNAFLPFFEALIDSVVLGAVTGGVVGIIFILKGRFGK